MKIKIPICIISVILLMTLVLSQEAHADDELAFLSEPGTRIGVGNGTAQERLVLDNYPDAEIVYCDKLVGYVSVAQGKVDAFIYDKMQMELAIKNGQTGVRILDQTVGEPLTIADGISATSSIPDLENKVNDFIAEIKADGTFDDMCNRWFIKQDFDMPDIPPAPDPKYTLKVGTTGDVEPYSFYSKDEVSGFDIEFCKRLAARIDAEVEFVTYDWSSIIPALQTGKVDLIASNIMVTKERAEQIIFSDEIMTIENGVMVRDDSTASDTSFFESVRSGFEKTFIREDRYKLFLSGIWTTIIITLLSIIFGTALGFVLYLLCRHEGKLATAFSRGFVGLIQGLPIVVILMIMYYIIFAATNISGTLVCVVAFTLVLASGVLNMIRTGVSAIDRGQTEAAYALGFSDLRTFFVIIFPQAIPLILPAYRGALVELVKATAIVGYIAVMDLTKIGDVIRSRTYEPFFPIIATAIIYFILGWCMVFLINRLEILINPRRRKKEQILKGVKTDDRA